MASQNVIALKKQTLKENNTELVREIQIMEQMSSPYVVGYYGSCLDGEVMWIVCGLVIVLGLITEGYGADVLWVYQRYDDYHEEGA